MDWTDFQLMYWFFRRGDIVLYIGSPDILKFTLINSKEVYYISPEKVGIKSPKLKNLNYNVDNVPKEMLPKKVDKIINFLPMNIVTSFKIMGNFIDLLDNEKQILVKLEIPKKQSQYSEMLVNELLPEFKLSSIANITIEGNKYIVCKKI
ncbi:MAG: hypothetical protein B6U88_03085 [Candidatus Aenigmarchaeota archaeon ex4484_56]|nr:MAG: hypothetical protein B6U88_03085 [Candidatus Aenigmarchaeota archaeon ex4484_56]